MENHLASCFGSLPGKLTLAVMKECAGYVAKYPSLSPAERAKPIGQFWASLVQEFPTVARLGKWYGEMPTSSVAAERVFSIMRSFESPQRHRMGHAMMRAELMAKVNSSL